jgi:PAS domain S-box-containing protein
MRDHAKLKILILEDRAADAELVLHELRQAGYGSDWLRVETELDYLAQLDQGWELILADYNLPLFSGLRALELLQERELDIPFILVSGTIAEDLAIAAMKTGAADYIMKDRLGRLGPAVERALGDAAKRRADKQAVKREQLAHRVLDLLNRSENATDTIHDILLAIRQVKGFEAVGIRLRQDNDFPYYTTDGFSEDFVRAERYLCQRDPTGELVRDSQGNPVLECMCGNILCGRINPALPVFTDGGSFWSNGTTQLLASTTEADRQACTRNRCNSDGYESVALIPLRSSEKIIGLLQLNDHRPNQFTLEMIQFFEGLGASIGIALARQQAAKTLQENEARYRTLVENIPQKIFLKDRDFRYVTVNENFVRDLGVQPEAVVGKTDYDYFPKEFADKYRADDTRVMTTGKTEELEERHGLASQKIWVHTIKTPLKDRDGKVVGIFGIFWDITERKHLEAQLLRNQRMESLGTLAGGIAHDLNNILAPISMSLGLLKDPATEAQERDALVAMLQDGVQRATDLVKQVLAFGRGLEGQRIPVNCNHLLREIGSVIRGTFPKSLNAHSLCRKELWPVNGDATQLHQVLMNLCVNARDAMPLGGQLTISSENIVLDETYARMNPDAKPGSYVLLTVADTGTGIPREIQDRIFEPFFTTKEVGKGTGLGLSTTFAIVKSHGGFIHLDSEPGQGTTFKVYLPANTAPQTGENPAAAPTQLPRGHGELVLVVDDEQTLRSTIQRVLQSSGYRVLLAAHGGEAVSLYAQHRKDVAVVLMDMAMPVMDGPTAIVALKAMNPQVCVISSSGHPTEEDLAKVKAAGVRHFVPKPYTAESLLETLAQALQPSA